MYKDGPSATFVCWGGCTREVLRFSGSEVFRGGAERLIGQRWLRSW
ncbi:MAG: hypothetical protein AVDCRST_MAG12-82 [uncultured Rubrobacteraceae bacterium]|uniref:Uncharacterized protein n=1 Tax=uncultured Rubrobacteraceae bacterium TaxID=349277 RepID=A0A6J4REX4_9ACTN|nr:MAG: hypothetical protein AVDCRST_MAG12-82 [uncultured Rubrobacteraceae bacterium]